MQFGGAVLKGVNFMKATLPANTDLRCYDLEGCDFGEWGRRAAGPRRTPRAR